jgi:RNA polymerase sigma factor (sigma-70 family)
MTDVQINLVEANMRLVPAIIRKYFYFSETDMDDAIQIGCIGLCKAAEKYNQDSGFKFSTFAASCIVNEIKYELRKKKAAKRDGITVSLDMDAIVGPFDIEKKREINEVIREIQNLPISERIALTEYIATGSQYKAAAAAGLTQPGASKAIKRARKKLIEKLYA